MRRVSGRRLNEALLGKAAEQRLLRTHKVRADTTVVPADVDYPTDSGLLAKAVTKMARTVRRVQAAGGARAGRVSRSSAVGRPSGAGDRVEAAAVRR